MEKQKQVKEKLMTIDEVMEILFREMIKSNRRRKRVSVATKLYAITLLSCGVDDAAQLIKAAKKEMAWLKKNIKPLQPKKKGRK